MSISVSSFEIGPDHQHVIIESVQGQPLSSQEKFLASLLLPGSATLGEVDASHPIEIEVGVDVTPQTIATLGIQRAVQSM